MAFPHILSFPKNLMKILFILPALLCYLISYTQDYTSFKGANGKYGFKDKSGKVAVEAKYSSVGFFQEGMVAVKDPDSGQWGYVDTKGTQVIAPQFETANAFSEGKAVVGKTGAKLSEIIYGYIDKT